MSETHLAILESRVTAAARAVLSVLQRVAYLDQTTQVLEARIADMQPAVDRVRFLELQIADLRESLCAARAELSDLRRRDRA